MEGKTEFVVFCIENLASRLGKNAADVYLALTDEKKFLSMYIIPNYEILHTQSKEYIIDDLLEAAKEAGVKI
ncbi:MAG: DUF3791 domain-containing protein [Clostridiales bacterium]|nr:DUF3791 domain-containing protein [Clostridiales bacterium]